jgi:hypothetical protein
MPSNWGNKLYSNAILNILQKGGNVKGKVYKLASLQVAKLKKSMGNLPAASRDAHANYSTPLIFPPADSRGETLHSPFDFPPGTGGKIV